MRSGTRCRLPGAPACIAPLPLPCAHPCRQFCAAAAGFNRRSFHGLRRCIRPPLTDQPVRRARNRLVLIVYTAAIFVSALLLFSVQPLFTKMVLPRLGGSPAVWSVAMVFFQSLLLGGYAYAHFLMQIRNRVIAGRGASGAAGGRAADAAAVDRERLGRAAGKSGYAFWLLGLFAVSIGLPFFALAANNPLLQAWFVRTGHPDGPDPYFLYASSNIGSFLALLSYPVLLEPMFTLRTQNLIWTGGYGLLIVLIAGCGVLLLRSPAMRQRSMREPTMPTRRRRRGCCARAGSSSPRCRRAC